MYIVEVQPVISTELQLARKAFFNTFKEFIKTD